MQLKGSFTSDCQWQPKDYCKGTCYVDLTDNDVFHGAKGRIRIEYDADSKFQPPMLIPRPLPSMPVTVERLLDNEFSVIVTTSWFSLAPWEKVFDLIGLSVRFTFDHKTKAFEGTYHVNGGMGIPRDAGRFVSIQDN